MVAAWIVEQITNLWDWWSGSGLQSAAAACLTSREEREQREAEEHALYEEAMRFLLRRRLTAWTALSARHGVMRNALRRLVHHDQHRGFGAWVAAVLESKRLQQLYVHTAKRILMMEESRGLNTWVGVYREERQRKARLKALLKRASPEGRALLKAISTWHEVTEPLRILRLRMSMLLHTQQMRALNTWLACLEERAALLAKAEAALNRMSPEGRAKMAFLGKLRELVEARRRMRTALLAFTQGGLRRAVAQWRRLPEFRLMAVQCTVWLAAQRGHRVGRLQELLESLDPALVAQMLEATDELGLTPLLWASKRGFSDVVEVLLAFADDDAGAVVGAKDYDECTALHHASRKSHNEIVAMLLGSGAAVNAANADKSTPLHWAARKNNVEGTRLLLDAGADALCRNQWGASALDNALFAGHHGVTTLLATDPEERREAEAKLALANRLRPSEAERERMMEAMAGSVLARREAARARLRGIAEARESQSAASRRAGKAEKRMAAADRALSKALVPAALRRAAAPGAGAGITLADFFTAVTHVTHAPHVARSELRDF